MQERTEIHILLSKQRRIIMKQICSLISNFSSKDVFVLTIQVAFC